MKTLNIAMLAFIASFITTITTTLALPGELPPDPSAVAYHRAQAQEAQMPMNGGGEEEIGMAPDHPSLRNMRRYDHDYIGSIPGPSRTIVEMRPLSNNPDAYFGFQLNWSNIRIMELSAAEQFCGYAGGFYGDDFARRGVLKVRLHPGQYVGVDVVLRRIVCDVHCENRLLYLGVMRPVVRGTWVNKRHCSTCHEHRPQVQLCRFCRGPITQGQRHRCGGGGYHGGHRQGQGGNLLRTAAHFAEAMMRHH